MTRNRIFTALILLLLETACAAPGSAAPTRPGPTAQPATGVTATPTPRPTAIVDFPTPTDASGRPPKRIPFAPGAILATYSDAINFGGAITYLVGAEKDQSISLTVRGLMGAIDVGVKSPSGAVILDPAAGNTSFTGQLPETGDYTITVAVLQGKQAAYSIQLIVPPVNHATDGSVIPQCWVTNPGPLDARSESSAKSAKFLSMAPKEQMPAISRTSDGWLSYQLDMNPPKGQGRARLLWYQIQGSSLVFDPPGCDATLPLALSLDSLLNGTYKVLGQTDVTLADGVYTNPSFDTTSAVRETRMTAVRAFGDLNGDGTEDAVIVMGTNTGGSGTFVEIWPVLNVNGSPQPGGSLTVGDRTPVNKLTFDAGVISAQVQIQGPNDAACCPSLNQTWQIRLVNGALEKQ